MMFCDDEGALETLLLEQIKYNDGYTGLRAYGQRGRGVEGGERSWMRSLRKDIELSYFTICR